MNRQRILLMVTLLALAGLTACGKSSASDGSGQFAAANTETPITSTTSTVSGTPVPTANVVRLELSQTSYAAHEAVVVNILNGLTTPITASDHHSGCSLVDLQWQTSSGAWQTIGKCLQGTATHLITLPAGTASVQIVSPGASNLTINATWASGTYRVAFTYFVGEDEVPPASLQSATIYSATFSV